MSTCPNIVTGDEGTSYCALAESSVAALRNERDQLRAERDQLEKNCTDVYDAGRRTEDHLRAEVERLTKDRDDWKAKHWKAHDDHHRIFLELAPAIERAEKAIAKVEQLESRVDDYGNKWASRDADAKIAEAELAKERARSTIHASFCDDALTLCEDTGIAGNIIAKMRELRRAAIDTAMKEDGK